jgi:sugar phosphate isomerase/epimerase
LPPISRRRFLAAAAATGASFWGNIASADASASPNLQFPSQPRDRIAIASYPFREFIAGKDHKSSSSTIELKDFAAHVIDKFNINQIEPWTGHFPSTDPKYLEQFRSTLEKSKAMVVNIAVDGTHSPYALNREERERAIAFSKQWIDAAAIIGSPSVRTNLPPASDAQPDLDRTAKTLARVIEYAAGKKVVVNLENDNPVSEDPFFLVKLIDKVNSPWLHALPDFCNTLAAKGPERGYPGIDAMFARAYSICHVKSMEIGQDGKLVRVDMEKTFAILKAHNYKGYCSMEFDSPGDPYAGTQELINTTVRSLA